jgi:hypothetical protein
VVNQKTTNDVMTSEILDGMIHSRNSAVRSAETVHTSGI